MSEHASPLIPPASPAAPASAAAPIATNAPASALAPAAATEPAPLAARRRPLKDRLADHVAKYGRVALITYLVLSLSAIAGFTVAIAIGAEPSSATGVIGVIGAGWLAAKATMPIRILLTLALTPVVATVVTRLRR